MVPIVDSSTTTLLGGPSPTFDTKFLSRFDIRTEIRQEEDHIYTFCRIGFSIGDIGRMEIDDHNVTTVSTTSSRSSYTAKGN